MDVNPILGLRAFFETFNISDEFVESLSQAPEHGETHQQQYRMLLEKIKTMNAEIRECELTTTSFSETFDDFNLKIDYQEGVIAIKEVDIVNLKTEIETLESEIRCLKFEINSIRVEGKAELVEYKINARREIDEMFQKNIYMELENKRMQEELVESNEEMAKINSSKLQKLTERINYLTQENERISKEYREWKIENNSRDNENVISEMNLKNQVLFQDINYLKQENKAISEDFQEYKRQFEKQLPRNGEDTSKLQEEIKELIKENQKLLDIQNLLTKGIKKNNQEFLEPTNEDENKRLKEENTEYKREYEELLLKYKDQRSEMANVKEENREYETQLKMVQENISQYKARPKQLND